MSWSVPLREKARIEEGLGVFGSVDELHAACKDPAKHQIVFKNCFMIYMGVLDRRRTRLRCFSSSNSGKPLNLQ